MPLRASRGPKMGPGTSRMPLRGTNMVPSRPKMANKLLQEASRWLQDASSRPQGGLRRAPGDPKMALRGAKRSPDASMRVQDEAPRCPEVGKIQFCRMLKLIEFSREKTSLGGPRCSQNETYGPFKLSSWHKITPCQCMKLKMASSCCPKWPCRVLRE